MLPDNLLEGIKFKNMHIRTQYTTSFMDLHFTLQSTYSYIFFVNLWQVVNTLMTIPEFAMLSRW